MKLLALPRYGRLGASSRLRTYQYLPWFRDAGIDVKVSCLLEDRYLRDMYAGIKSWRLVAAGYASRISRLVTSGEFDTIFIEKEALPWLPAFTEINMLSKHVRLVVDYDDAIFHTYDQHSSWFVRSALGKKLDRVMKRADLVTAGNGYLAEYATRAGCRHVEQVPTVIDLQRYFVNRMPSVRCDEVVIGWIGSPSTARYLSVISEALMTLSKRHNLRFVAIGARPEQLLGTPFVAVEWREDAEVELLQSLDIGIMPLRDDLWERGKCGYKLIQYMACGLPVLASAVGANFDIINHGENGFLCDSPDAWINHLESLIMSRSLRVKMGDAGRGHVEREYCLQIQGPRLAKMLLE